MKKYLSGVLIWSLSLAVSLFLYSWMPGTFASLGKRIDDLFFIGHPPPQPSNKIVIVDIDEKSLAALGQWPWERDLVSRLLRRLTENGAGIIGLDILFAEADKTSPSYINRRANLHLVDPLDHDEVLAKTLRETPVIGGYVFDMMHTTPSAVPPDVKALFVEKYLGEETESPDTFYRPKGVIPNIRTLQTAFYSSGFFNIIPDASGMIRRTPLLMRYQDALYPSLDLEMIRTALGEERITVYYGKNGLEALQIGDRTVPVDAQGTFPIYFRGASRTFPYVSAADVLNGTFPENIFKDTFVLIGSSSAGLLDLRSIPLDNAIAGVEIHANILDNILTGDFLSQPSWITGVNATIFFAVFTLAYFVFLLFNALWLPIAVGLFTFLSYGLVQWLLFEKHLMINTAFPFLALLLALFSAGLVNYFFESRQKRLIRDTLAKKVSPEVAEELIRHADTDILSNREEEITVFFSDIRNFTSLSEKIGSAHDLIKLLNRYVDPMTEIILSHRGTIDKFIGDAIMAYWNAPQQVANHCDAAVQSSLKQLDALKKLNQQNRQYQLPSIRIGIGINTGRAIVGEVGSQGRSDFTVIGDSVNLAARLQDLNKVYGTTLIISESTKNCLTGDYILRELDRTQVRGKEEIIRIYEVLAEGIPDLELKNELDAYHIALTHYYAGNLSEAQDHFKVLMNKTPSTLYAFHVERIQKALRSPN